MKLSDVKGVFKARVEVGDFFGVEKADAWIEVREPTQEEILSATLAKSKDATGMMIEIVGECISDHNFENEAGEFAKIEEVLDVLKAKGFMFMRVFHAWEVGFPLASTTAGKSDS